MYPPAPVDRALRLSDIGVTDREIAQIFGVSVAVIQRWRAGRRRAASGIAGLRATACPRCYPKAIDESAYAYLLGLYLGDGYIVRGRKDVYALSIACADNWPGLIEAAGQAVSIIMPMSRVCRVRQQGCTMVKSYSKHWPCLFPQFGPGRKHHRRIELESWQDVIVSEFPGEFAKGLFHSDGWRGVNRIRARLADGDHWYEYPRYLFTNESEDILRLCGEALDRLGVEWRFSRRNSISVARRKAVARLDEFVGPKY